MAGARGGEASRGALLTFRVQLAVIMIFFKQSSQHNGLSDLAVLGLSFHVWGVQEMSQAEDILRGLGGTDNIDAIEPCITRLRVEVVDPNLVNDEELSHAGAFGVVQVGNTVQVVVGPVADDLAEQITDLNHNG